jgi:hypothetical protein
MKIFLRLLFLHIVFFTLGTFLFVLSFRTGLFESINVLFYRGVILLTATCLLMIILLIFYKKSKYGSRFIYRDIILSITLIFCLNLVFFTHLPVTADRSISVFLLGAINRSKDTGLNKQEISKVFIEKYVNLDRAIDKRLKEQIISGNIILVGSKYIITDQGNLLIGLYSIVSDLFRIDKKLINL